MQQQLLIIIVVTFLAMISPGPDMVIVLRNTLVQGRSKGLMTSLGVLTGNLVHISYCILGIAWLISQSILAFNIMKYAGALYLIWLGIKSLSDRESSSTIDEAGKANNTKANKTLKQRVFLQGLINNILNPKGTLFYLGVFTVVILPDTPLPQTLIMIITMMSVSLLFWLFFVLTIGHPLVRNVLNSGHRVINQVFGVLLIALGIRVLAADT